MTFAGWAQIVIFLIALTALTPLVGGYMARVYQGERGRARLACRTVRAPAVPHPSGPSRRGAGLEGIRALALLVQPGELAGPLRRAAHPGRSNRSIRRASRLGPVGPSFNTASSFVCNTSWQYYAGETTLSDFSQMAGITVASFTSMRDRHGGRCRAHPRAGAPRHRSPRQLLGRPHPLAAVRADPAPVVDPRSCSSRTGVPQTLEHYLIAHASTHSRRRSRSGRSPPRRRSSCCPATAAASSTPTPRIRSRTRPACRTSSRRC